MNKKIFFIILCVIGLVLWAVSFFFGFNYAQKGALMVSIPVAIFVLVIMGGMIYLMKRFSNPSPEVNYSVAKNTEKVAIGIYAVASLCTAVYIGHFVSVTMNDKTEIQDKVNKELQELNRIFNTSVDVEGSYMKWVDTQCRSYNIQLQKDDVSSSTIEVKVSDLENELVNKSGFSNLRNNVQSFLESCSYSVNNWVWLTLSEKISLLEENKPKWESAVEQCALYAEYSKNEPYKCNSTVTYTDIAKSLTSISGKDFSISAIILVLVLQVMILLTYFSERPNTGRDPIKYKNTDFARSYGTKKPTPNPSKPKTPSNQGGEKDESGPTIVFEDED